MGYHVTHIDGATGDMPLSEFRTLLLELGGATDEWPDVSVTHESGWSLGIRADHSVYLENVEPGGEGPFHMGEQTTDDVLTLMSMVARGAIAQLRALAWMPGYE